MNFVQFRALFLANFGEHPKGEVRRIPILRTRVNKGMKKGRSYDARPNSAYAAT